MMNEDSFGDANNTVPPYYRTSPAAKSLVNKRVVGSCIIISVLLGGFAAVVLFSGKFLLNGKVPMAPGAAFGFGEYLLRTDQCTVGGADGTVVERVFEPRDFMHDAMNAELLLQQIEKLATAGPDGKRRKLTPKMVQRGYLDWLVRADEPPFNFTLGGARKTAIEIATRFNVSCLCYLFMGIAENIVLLRTPPSAYEVLYEPSIVTDSPKATLVAYEEKYPLFSLIHSAMAVRAARDSEPAVSPALEKLKVSSSFVTASSGMVASITESAGIRRAMYDEPHFPCIRYCTEYLNSSPQK